MTVLLAVIVTAILVGATAYAVAQQAARTALNAAIGGRSGQDPVDEHRRLLVRAQEQTEAAEARADLLDLALDGLTAGVVITDHAGKVLVRNRLASSVSTRAHEQTLVDAACAELVAEAVQGTSVEREVEIFGPPPRILFIHAVPIAVRAEVIGALAVIEDVSDSHRIDKTRRDFIANLSHELRTPVGAVSLLAEMLDGEDDPDIRTSLSERLLLETDRMTHTIDDLLELSRIESDTEGYDDVIVVQELADEALARTRVAAEAKGVEVGVIAPNDPITLVGNRDQLLSALVNLVENAVKYSDPNDAVSVRARIDGETLELVVQDTGQGIPARDLDRIFERFYRVDRSRDLQTGGTGIGLSIVRHVALNHGGAVSVDSFEGDGSTFTLSLPVVLADADLGSDVSPSGEEVT
ncbi:MAG: ATP-binding protein [Actinomycetota bacterium]